LSSGWNLRSAGLRNETSANGKPSFAESESLFLEQRQSTFSSSPRHTFPGLTSTSRLKRRDRGSEAGSTLKENFMALTPIHPGEHLKEEPEALNTSAAELARKVSVPTNRITHILNGRRGITGDTASSFSFLPHESRVLAKSSRSIRSAVGTAEGGEGDRLPKLKKVEYSPARTLELRPILQARIGSPLRRKSWISVKRKSDAAQCVRAGNNRTKSRLCFTEASS
jgi:hypothetical protein